MSRPRKIEDPLNDKVLYCCYLVQKYIELDMGENKKELEDIAHDAKNIENTGVPVIDATANDFTNTIQDDGTIIRKSTDGKITGSTKSPEDVKRIQKLQKINNNNKLKRRGNDKEI